MLYFYVIFAHIVFYSDDIFMCDAHVWPFLLWWDTACCVDLRLSILHVLYVGRFHPFIGHKGP